MYVLHADATLFLRGLGEGSVDMILTDPPQFGIVKDSWDNQWASEAHYTKWLSDILLDCLTVLAPHGSLLVCHSIGKHGQHPIFDMVRNAEKMGFCYRNWLTWKKRKAYGKDYDYLFVREEIIWFSKSHVRSEVIFNKPYLDEKRGYAGWNKKYPAKSEFKRVGNVMMDVCDYDGPIIEEPDLMKPKRTAQKPPKLFQRLIETHSNVGNFVVDPFVGFGTTGIEALKLNRCFFGCEKIEADAIAANKRCEEAFGV